MPTELVHVALTLALAESLGLALLLLRVRGVPGLRLLVGFLLGVATWVLSCELPVWFGAPAERLAVVLVGLSPLTSAVFLHFVLVLCGGRRSPRWLWAVYAGCGFVFALGLLVPAGRFQPWLGFERFFMPSAMGWSMGFVWAVLAVGGHLMLLRAWWRRPGPPRGQLVAMCLSSGWGALCMTGYAFAPFGVERYPFPLLLLPLYPLILVYGILRYRLMVVNAWARRGLAWALVIGLGSALIVGLGALWLPFGGPLAGWRLWLVAVGTLLASGLLLDPFRRLATRLVYPGSKLGADDLDRWRQALARAETPAALADTAARLLSAHLRVPLDVEVFTPDAPAVGHGGGPGPGGGHGGAAPALRCRPGPAAGHWHTELRGWEAAPPGPRYVAQLFGTALAEAAQRLAQALVLARRERAEQQQARLAELGGLAATVAHDIRNPLNVIAMAAADAPPDARREIAAQTQRIAQLASDLLDYAKSWQLDLQPLDLGALVRATAARYPEFHLGPALARPLPIRADARRLRGALLNLFDNARAAVGGPAGGAVEVAAEAHPDGGLHLLVCDTGTGIPAEIRDSLFQPFVSRRADGTGTGLGLAIVARVMEAHGGSARLATRAGWTTCFVLAFPPWPLAAPEPAPGFRPARAAPTESTP